MYRTTDLYALFDFEGHGEYVDIGLHQFELSQELMKALKTATFGSFADDQNQEYSDTDILLFVEHDTGTVESLHLSALLERGLSDDETLVGWNTNNENTEG